MDIPVDVAVVKAFYLGGSHLVEYTLSGLFVSAYSEYTFGTSVESVVDPQSY
jgi:hypothetical protein